ncbi:MAG: aldolase/citrate lyase family protein [Actinomycetota bacterium]|nr:aldolase/citrate lyase family protein [Actinomycetota bacterium]
MIGDLAVSELMRDADLDFILVDMQHVALSVESLQRMVIALQPGDLSVLVRPASNDPVLIGQALDVGATGVVVPMVNSAADVRRAVSAAHYPPEGQRSWGPSRRAMRGDAGDYSREANREVVVLTQVETALAVKNLDEILEVEGLSGVMIGPADLAISLGYPDDRNNAEVEGVFASILERCLERDIPFGFFASNASQAGDWITRGSLVTTCSSDLSFVANGIQELAGTMRSAARRAGSTG